MSKSPPLYLSRLWDGEGLCSPSLMNPSLNKVLSVCDLCVEESIIWEHLQEMGFSNLKTQMPRGS